MKYYLSNLLKIDLAFIYCFNLLTTEQSLKEKLKKLKKIFSWKLPFLLYVTV